ncbi:MAG: hypothetical protein ACRDSJ_00615 [Rubrobacteraceae bacterium]
METEGARTMEAGDGRRSTTLVLEGDVPPEFPTFLADGIREAAAGVWNDGR